MSKKLVQRAIELQKKIDSLKSLYEELDDITLKLTKARFKSAKMKDHTVFLVDNFANQNHAFRTTSIRRFELKFERKKK